MASDGLGAGAAGADMLQEMLKQRFAEVLGRRHMQQEQQRLQQDQQRINQTGDYQRGENQARQDAIRVAASKESDANLEQNNQALRSAQMVTDPTTTAPVRLAIQYRNATGANLPGEALKDAPAAPIPEPIMRVNPRTGAVEKIGEAPKGSHFVEQPAPPVAKDTSAADASRLDRSYQYHATALDKMRKPYDDLSQRLSKLHDTMAQGTPQADALVAPELMTVMAGGMGSGLRLNEAEIARVIGGRSQWQNLQAAAQRWSLDPKTANSITPEQRQQIHALVGTVEDRVRQAQGTLDAAGDELVGSSDPTAHRHILNEAHKKLNSLSTGTPASSGAATGTGPKAGDTKVFPNGRKAVFDGTGWVAQ